MQHTVLAIGGGFGMPYVPASPIVADLPARRPPMSMWGPSIDVTTP